MSVRRLPDAGVSLVEVLVVLSIVGVLTGASVLAIGALDRRSDTEAAARRLAARLNLAMDAAIASGNAHALAWDRRHYAFFVAHLPDGRWTIPHGSPLSGPHDLAPGLQIVAEGEAALLISPDAPEAAKTIEVRGRSDRWHIGFDGIVARPTRAGLP